MRVNLIHNGNYHTTKAHTSKIKDNAFKHPCVQHVNRANEPSCIWYSTTNELGMFGIPKVIFGRKNSGVMVDMNGDYGISEDCSGIIDSVENLESIQRLMASDDFIQFMRCFDFRGTNDFFNHKAIALFKQDFWKEFL